MNIADGINKVLNNYLIEKTKQFKANELNGFFTREIPEILYKELQLERERYLIKASMGKGNWANIPWIAIFDRTICESATEGYYIVLLFREDMSGFYISINQGCTWFNDKYGRKNGNKNMAILSESMRNKLALNKSSIDLHSSASLAQDYQLGNIYSCLFERNDVDNERIKKIIWDMLEKYYNLKLIVGNSWEKYNINTIDNSGDMNLKNDDIDDAYSEFKKFYYDNKEALEKSEEIHTIQKRLVEFRSEYSIEKLKDLKLEDYAIGNNNTNSLCYKIEFGKYKKCGPGIGGSSAYKYGIFNTENGYKSKFGEDFENIWNEIRSSLLKLLSSIEDAVDEEQIEDDFEFLKGMSNFIVKLAYCYFPEKIICVASREKLRNICDEFEIEWNKDESSIRLAFRINKKIRTAIPELKDEDPTVLGWLLYSFMFDETGDEEFNMEDEEEIDNNETYYWLYSPGENACKWDEFYHEGIMAIGWDELGDLRNYNNKEEIRKEFIKVKEGSNKNSVLANWEFANEMRPGDIVFVKKGRSKILGKGIVESDYIFDDSRKEFKSLRKVNWINHEEKDSFMELGEKMNVKTLTDITPYGDYVEKLNKLYDEKEPESYTKAKFIDEVFIDEPEYDILANLLLNKKNIILQGAPGVGKTFMAKRLAYAVMGKEDDKRVKSIQFHQSYSYEDFVEGYRPTEKSFELEKGVFYNFCKLAEKDPERKYFFIIDEINRGNISKIFGELLMLMENDKRGESINLAYSKELFNVPKNVYIIGMMNTADRSLALMDYALRRRFAFYKVKPAFENENFKKYQEGLNNNTFNDLIRKVEELNEDISKDASLGEGFEIGHSYFCNYTDIDKNKMLLIVNYEILPILEEYWFDNQDKYEEWRKKLNGVLGVLNDKN